MNMSKAIVEAIYSMEPPGRFLKNCLGETEQWRELSKREAADKAAQAMAYAIKGESLKQKRREQRRSLVPPSLPPHDDVDADSSPSANRLTNNQLGGFRSSPVARHGLAAARGSSTAASGANNNAAAESDSGTNEMLLPDNSHLILSRQLLQQLQLLQSNTTTTLLQPTSGAPPDQNGLTQIILAQTLQQQLLFQRILNQQNVLSSATLPPTISSSSAPFSSAPPANAMHHGTSSNFSLAGYVGISNTPQGAQQMDQLQRSLMLQPNQLLASSLINPSYNHLLLQQRLESQRFDNPLLHQGQAALQLQQKSQDPPLPSISINSAAELLSPNRRNDPSSPREEGSGDDEQSGDIYLLMSVF